MRQEYKYTVTEVGPKVSTILEEKDAALVGSYRIGTVSSFNPDESRLDAIVYDLDGNILEAHQDISDYAVRGVEQGAIKINQLEVNPAGFMEDRTFLGDIIVEYKAYDNVFSKGKELYITDISSDRTEVRAKSVDLSSKELRYHTNLLQNKLNNQSYFYGAFLESLGIQIPILNIITEAIESDTVVTLKLYSALPAEIDLKSRFQVLESLGESSQFQVHRELTVIPDETPTLKGPNFEIDVTSSTIATDYKNYTDLLSQKSWENSKELYTTFKSAIHHTSVDYEDFSDFIHFSSAFERLENARYKFEKIFEYQIDLEESQSAGKVDDAKKIQESIDGIIENFDHYENYLWFESGSKAWPKKIDPDTRTAVRPFVNENNPDNYVDWYNNLVDEAEGYDNNNKDILISTIPVAIREDVDHNEPYLMFIHMIGQHFDDLWIYARAITDRYNGDNRMEFGISKELVKDALQAFGVELYETNQNLTAFFDLCQPDGTYDWGEELEGREGQKSFIRVDTDRVENPVSPWIEQPVIRDNYTKEVYKRIYHNIPALLKMKGTSRGLRVLLNCFGIPNDILKFRVQGGTDASERPFFGPEETVNIFNEGIDSASGLIDSPAGVKKIRTGNKNEPILEYRNIDGTGSFYRCSTLSRYTTVTSSNSTYTDDSHKVEIGFDVNEAINRFFEKELKDEDFTVDDVIGDPRNKEDQYGDPWKSLREALLKDVILPEDPGTGKPKNFRAPAAIIRLVRYFDSTFFRMLKDFLPARASIDSGAIIKDNILHRNRWKGTNVSWMELTKSGSVSGSSVEGSHGGSFRRAGHKIDTGDEIYISTGDQWKTKKIPSGSREINGELSGSKISVTDGDLSKYNKHRKDNQPYNNFYYNFWFLDLPDPPFCRAKLSPEYYCEYWTFKSVGRDNELDIVPVEISSPLTDGAVYHAFVETPDENQRAEVSRSHWRGDDYTFMGWYVSGSVTPNYGQAETPGRQLYLSPYAEGPKYQWEAHYASASVREILWMEQLRPTASGYYGSSILLAWKLLNSSKDPRSDKTELTGSVINKLGGMNVSFLIENGYYEVEVPDEVTFGTNNAYYWVNSATPVEGNIQKYGIKKVGSCTGPWKNNNYIVDATWFDSYEDWNPIDFRWPVTVGNSGSIVTPEN